ncbi:MAG: RNA-binding S4 domain-containing protein [Bauldia sp.]|uniref:RNA-binding S4 domain-containing protein n=1 Tax=Bauldia sp. TaxID=2575872 RepID=UPI001DBBADD9|nr:RNA-binding S4 domain-containing protein [Bauldia sp.]MCB1495576.1 RNA-binding S4 domain-containing protein [Bauldia sp.]
MAAGAGRRIDKWLWYVRLARTRTAAQKLAISGSVRVNSEKNTSASRTIRIGDVLTVGLGSGVRVLRVVGLGERRGPASEARLLYEDLTLPEPPRDRSEARRIGPRPTKRDRRKLDSLLSVAPVDDDFPPTAD